MDIIEDNFVPDNELIVFATDFCCNYKIIHHGTYLSSGQRYVIRYGYIENTWDQKACTTFARVSRYTRNIEINSSVIGHDVSADYIYWLIMWCVARCKYDSDAEADYHATQHFIKTGRALPKIYEGWALQAKVSGYPDNMRERIKAMTDRIENYVKRYNRRFLLLLTPTI